MRKWVFVVALAILLNTSLAQATQMKIDPLGIYTTLWGEVALSEGVDPYLLYAVAIVESGKVWDDGKLRPWPWAINVAGKGHYPASREEAELLYKNARKKTSNIDLGVLQINVRYHGQKVENPTDLLDYHTNLRLAAQILKTAVSSAPNDPELGVGRYHIWADEKKARTYGRRVLHLSDALKNTPGGKKQ